MQQSNASAFNINNLGGASEFKKNVMAILSKMNTGELVKVTAVNASGLNPVGFVSVKFLTQRTGADGNNIELGEVHNVPYFRLQGGKNAVIIDPEIGDIGYCGFCSRDISIVKRTRKVSAQNMKRISSESDAFYFGAWNGITPEQYIYFKDDSIHVKATTKVVIDAPMTEVENNMLVKGNLMAVGTVTSQTNIIDPIGSMAKMRTQYNEHDHIEQGDGQPTSPPSTEMN